MTDATGWPDPARPGVPLNPAQDSEGHVISLDGVIEVYRWEAKQGLFLDKAGRWLAPADFDQYDKYLGRIYNPAEVAAREAAAWCAGRDAGVARGDKWTRDHYGEGQRLDIIEAIAQVPLPADLSDALARVCAEAVREGMERAAGIVDQISVAIMDGRHAPNSMPRCVVTSGDCAAAIRAEAKEAGDEWRYHRDRRRNRVVCNAARAAGRINPQPCRPRCVAGGRSDA